ncbi:LacI family DNA-binding transcriptional regulator, partial [Rhizobiaceae sp. 2RAB30]
MDRPPPTSPSSPEKAAPLLHGAPTIRDLARIAGVSIGTVSKALNDGG